MIPETGTWVEKGDLLLELEDDKMEQELRKTENELAQVRMSISLIGAGGSQGGYRNWLMAEAERLSAASGKISESLSRLEVRAPISGRVSDVNKVLRMRGYVSKDRYLLTICDPRNAEVRAYAREDLYRDLKGSSGFLGG